MFLVKAFCVLFFCGTLFPLLEILFEKVSIVSTTDCVIACMKILPQFCAFLSKISLDRFLGCYFINLKVNSAEKWYYSQFFVLLFFCYFKN